MIRRSGQSVAWNSPEVPVLGGAVSGVLALLVSILRAAGREFAPPLANRVQGRADRQERRAGGIMCPRRRVSVKLRCCG